jgi:hypothetical protein
VCIFDPIYSKRPITYFLLSGGAVGGAILLVSAFWFVRRRLYFAVSQLRPVNVLPSQDDEEDRGHHLPQNYVPEPFVVPDGPDPTTRGKSEPASTHDLSLSMSTVTADRQRPQTPIAPTTPTRRRPIRIIQHDDASPSEDLSGQLDTEPETIELPPAYSNIRQLPRQLPRSPPASSSRTGELATAAENES